MGTTKSCDVTNVDTGLPGKPKTNFGSPLITPLAKVFGKPGFIRTRPK